MITLLRNSLQMAEHFEIKFNQIQETEDRLIKDLNNKVHELIKQAISDTGIDADNESSVKENIKVINIINDKFDHFYFRYGTPEEKRIISVQNFMTVDMENDKITASYKYY